MKKLLWLFAFFGALGGGFIALLGFGAPAVQQNSFYLFGLSCGVLPFCLAFAWSELQKD